jgi:hypothetical protein
MPVVRFCRLNTSVWSPVPDEVVWCAIWLVWFNSRRSNDPSGFGARRPPLLTRPKSTLGRTARSTSYPNSS